MLSIVTVASCAWRHLIDLIGFLVKVTERQRQSFVQTSAYTSIFKGQSAECLYAFQGSSVTLRGHICHVNKRPPPVGTGTCLVALSDEAGPAGARPGRVLTPLPLSPLTPAFDFYQRRRFALGDSARTSALLPPSPYVPQCDALGRWEPVQCYARTGEGAWMPLGGRVTPLLFS